MYIMYNQTFYNQYHKGQHDQKSYNSTYTHTRTNAKKFNFNVGILCKYFMKFILYYYIYTNTYGIIITLNTILVKYVV